MLIIFILSALTFDFTVEFDFHLMLVKQNSLVVCIWCCFFTQHRQSMVELFVHKNCFYIR